MSRVNIDLQAFVDSRFARLAASLGLADADHALGKMARVWMECTTRETEILTQAELGFAFGGAYFSRGDDVANAIVSAELGDVVDEKSVRVRGCKGRTDWLAKKRKAGRKGGKSGGRPAQAKRDSASAKKKANPKHPETPLAPALAPAPALSSSYATSGTGCREGQTSLPGVEPAKPQPAAEHGQLVAHFDGRYRAAHDGAKPTWGKAQHGMLKRLAKQHGAAEVTRRIDRLFDSPPSWLEGRDLRTLVANFDRLVPTPAKRSSGSIGGRMLTPLPSPDDLEAMAAADRAAARGDR